MLNPQTLRRINGASNVRASKNSVLMEAYIQKTVGFAVDKCAALVVMFKNAIFKGDIMKFLFLMCVTGLLSQSALACVRNWDCGKGYFCRSDGNCVKFAGEPQSMGRASKPILLLSMAGSYANASYEYCNSETNCKYYVDSEWSSGVFCKPGNQGWWIANSNRPCNPESACRPKKTDCYCYLYDEHYPQVCPDH